MPQDYFLHYRGLSFTFSIPREFHSLYQSSNDMPLELPVRAHAPQVWVCRTPHEHVQQCVPQPLTQWRRFRRTVRPLSSAACSCTVEAICCAPRCRLQRDTTASVSRWPQTAIVAYV